MKCYFRVERKYENPFQIPCKDFHHALKIMREADEILEKEYRGSRITYIQEDSCGCDYIAYYKGRGEIDWIRKIRGIE